MRGTDLGPWLATPPAPASRLPPAFAEVEDKRMVVAGTDKLLCDLHWGSCAYYDLAADPARAAQPGRGAARARGRAARGCSTTGWTVTCASSRCWPRARRIPKGGPLPKAIERGRLGDLLAGPELAAIMTSRRAARAAARGGAAAGGAAAAAGDGGGAGARGGRRRSRRSPTGRRSAPPGWATRRRAPRVQAIVADPAGRAEPARARGAGAGGGRRHAPACPCWATRSITARTCCSAAASS